MLAGDRSREAGAKCPWIPSLEGHARARGVVAETADRLPRHRMKR